MGVVIAIVGDSGTGKTQSMLPNKEIGITGLDPAETVIVSVAGKGKDLLFPGAKKAYKTAKLSEGGNHVQESRPEVVAAIIRQVGGGIDPEKRTAIEPNKNYLKFKNLVIDDAQYFQGFSFMDKVTEKGYDKFNQIGHDGFVPLLAAAQVTRPDLNIIFTYHAEETNTGKRKIKTGGKVIDNMLTLEGLFNFVFFTSTKFDLASQETRFFFETRTDGFTTAKTPPGCFKDFQIKNDMHEILKRINEYLGENE